MILYRWPQPQTEVTGCLCGHMECVFHVFFFLSAYVCTYVYIYVSMYYRFICSIILKYCKYTCLIKYISISIDMDLPIRNQSCVFVRTLSIVYIVTDMVMVVQSGYCRLITTKSVCCNSLENPPTIISTAQGQRR